MKRLLEDDVPAKYYRLSNEWMPKLLREIFGEFFFTFEASREKGLVKWNCYGEDLRAISMVKAPPHDDVKSSILGNKWDFYLIMLCLVALAYDYSRI